MKNPSKSSLTNKLDKVVSRIVRSRGYCVWGATGDCSGALHDRLQCAHIFSRTYRSVRWDLRNLVCLCASCHFYAHKNPVLFTEFVQGYLGEIEYESLKQRATPTKKWLVPDMVKYLKSLENL